MSALHNRLKESRGVLRAVCVAMLLTAVVGINMILPPAIAAASEDCDGTLILYDPHDLVLDTDVLVDLSTLIEVEDLVYGYTQRIDDALDAEFEGVEPPDGVSSDDLIDEGQWEVEDAIDLGRSIAGCED